MIRIKGDARVASPPEPVPPRHKAQTVLSPAHGNDNEPFDPLAWRRKYMKIYMQKRRERERAAKAENKAS